MAVAAVAVAAVLAVAPALGGERSRPRADAKVAVRDNFFSPRSLTVHRGDVVKWVWKGENRHNVYFTKVPAGARRRGASARRDGRWYRKFRRPGHYRYVCKLFAGMRGSITVSRRDGDVSRRAFPRRGSRH